MKPRGTFTITTPMMRAALADIGAEIRRTAHACSIAPMRGDPERLNKSADAIDVAVAHLDAHVRAMGMDEQ